MTDALMDRIKAHRSAPDVYDLPTFDQMADRIEQLEAACRRMREDRDRAIGWRDLDLTRAKTAETKLAKAVEALREIESITVHSGGDINRVKASAWRDAFEQAHCEACAALTELEWKKE